jgi:mannose-1-phosphate guanylyltransferase
MKALILCAGYGTRLKVITKNTPKCLVDIKGVPLLEIWLKKLSELNINKILLNTHYLSDQVESFIEKSNYKNKCKLIHEDVLLGTAGTLLKNIDDFDDEECILLHSDNYTEIDINNVLIAHRERPKNCLITMLTFETNNPSSCGIVELKNNIVIKLHEKVSNPPSNLANGAFYILSKEALNIIKNKYGKAQDFVNDILSNFMGKIYVYHTKDFYIDIGTPENYFLANSR